MQARPPAHQGGFPAIPYHPPVTPAIHPHIGQLIPRIRIAIQDIDVFQNMVAQGVIDSSMPSWDALLRQYTILMGRLSAISQSLTTLSADVPLDPNDGPSRHRPRLPTSIRQYLLTPLNALPADADPMVQAAFMESLNTMPLNDLQLASNALLEQELGIWKPATELKKMDENDLTRYRDALKRRLEKESLEAKKLGELARSGELKDTWKSRIGEGDAEDEEDGLFDEPEDDGEAKAAADKLEAPPKLSNPREGWALADYIKYIDTGAAKS